ncbi:GNAT family N-acetyltransferase [Yersinia sp. 2541 StPb PI]|uniref:GNAT family N-acetyltransferase n=1 Tax=Yersinia sp. 2541 StPb PI TaxID=3117407 RepID=UPI003FA49052
MEPLLTDRLLLIPLTLQDADQIQLKFPVWAVVKYLDASAVPWPYPADGALTFVRDIALPKMQCGSRFFWSIRPKVSPETLIGVINLACDTDDHRGFWLSPVWQGQGLITEASDAVTHFWFTQLDQPYLRVTKAAPNKASAAISRKNGMRLVATQERDYVSGHFQTEIWEISREEWLRNKR